jgi:hypothetical protein
MENPAPPENQFHVSPLKAAVIAVITLGGIVLGTWLTLPKMNERGRAQERHGRMRTEPAGISAATAAPIILDGDFVWVAGTGSDGFWIGRYAVGKDEITAFATATGAKVQDVAEAAAGRAEVRVPADTARQYCDWLTRTTGIPHRLPDEAEWMRLVGAGAGSGQANDTGIYPAGHREWVTLPEGSSGAVALFPPGAAAELGAFRVIRTGPPPLR